MNSTIFKKIWNLMYDALTMRGIDEARMYGKNMYLFIESTEGYEFSILFVGCRNHFKNIKGKEKTFGKAEEIVTVECKFSDLKFVKKTLNKKTMYVDYNSSIDDVYTVMNKLEIDWKKTISDWLNGEKLISTFFEDNCTVSASKQFKKELLSLLEDL